MIVEPISQDISPITIGDIRHYPMSSDGEKKIIRQIYHSWLEKCRERDKLLIHNMAHVDYMRQAQMWPTNLFRSYYWYGVSRKQLILWLEGTI